MICYDCQHCLLTEDCKEYVCDISNTKVSKDTKCMYEKIREEERAEEMTKGREMDECPYYDTYCCFNGHCGYQYAREDYEGNEYVLCGIEDEFQKKMSALNNKE